MRLLQLIVLRRIKEERSRLLHRVLRREGVVDTRSTLARVRSHHCAANSAPFSPCHKTGAFEPGEGDALSCTL